MSRPADTKAAPAEPPARRPPRGGDVDLILPLVTAIGIVLGWYVVLNYEQAIMEGAVAAFGRAQMAVVRVAVRQAETDGAAALAAGRSQAEAMEAAAAAFRREGAFLPGTETIVGEPLPPFTDMPTDGSGEGTGRILRSRERGMELAAWAPARVGEAQAVMAAATPLPRVVDAMGLTERSRDIKLMMTLLSIGGMGLAFLAARDSRARRRAEVELEAANAELSRRMVRRTAELKARTRALYESRLREQLKEKEAEVAYQAGLVEAAGAYLHDVGNALSALDALLLRMDKTLGSASRLREAFDAALTAHAEAVAGQGPDKTDEALALLKEAVAGRTLPRLAEALAAMVEVKRRMADDLERRRAVFAKGSHPGRFLQSIRVGREVEALLEAKRPAFAARGIALVTDIDPAATVVNRKHPLVSGLKALVVQALAEGAGEAGTGREVAFRVGRPGEAGSRVRIEIAGVPAPAPDDPLLAAFINFLNENNGSYQASAAGPDGRPTLTVEIGDAPEQPA